MSKEPEIEKLEREDKHLRHAVEHLRKAGYGYNHKWSTPLQSRLSKIDDKLDQLYRDSDEESGDTDGE